MSKKTKKGSQAGTESGRRAIPNEDGSNPFVNLKELLSRAVPVTVGTLATAIETFGVYSWDKFGRFKKFEKDTDEAQRALALLALVHEFENDPWPKQSNQQSPLDKYDGPDDPFANFGWATEVLPKFNAIRAGQFEVPSKVQSFGKRADSTYLHMIGALLDCIAGTPPGVDKHPSFESEAKLIEKIADHYDGIGGLSLSNLQRKFPAAKRSLSEG